MKQERISGDREESLGFSRGEDVKGSNPVLEVCGVLGVVVRRRQGCGSDRRGSARSV